MNEDTAVECMKAGAVDYVIKQNLIRLGPAVHSALERKAIEAAKIKAERDLRESEEFNRRIIESSDDCVKLLDFEGNLLFMSIGGQRLFEIDDIAPLLNKSWLDYWQGADRQSAVAAFEEAKKGNSGTFQGYSPTMKGTPKWWDVSVTPVTDHAGKIKSLMAV